MNKIMVVDDEAAITTQLEERLNAIGYNVVGRASSGDEAITMARKSTPDLVLMDIVMPGEHDGIEASEIIKKELDTAIIFLTAYANDELINRARIVEPFGYILKPFDLRAIKASIEIALYKKERDKKIKDSVDNLKKILSEKNTQMKEANHRIKNNLLIVSSVLDLQARRTIDNDVKNILQDCRDRVNAISLLHEKIEDSTYLREVGSTEYLKDLVKNLFKIYGEKTDNIKLILNIQDASLEIKNATAIGLIVNELVTNSIKHAFPDENMKGEIRIDFIHEEPDECTLIVSDNGVGLPEDFDLHSRETLGTQLISALTKQLNGEISISRGNGVKFSIKMVNS